MTISEIRISEIRKAIPEIKKVLEQLKQHAENDCQYDMEIIPAVVKIGLQACNDWGTDCPWGLCPSCRNIEQHLVAIANILREAKIKIQ